VGKSENKYILYCKTGYEKPCYNNFRFKDTEWFTIPSAELVLCEIPMNHPLIEIINKKFPHLIME
jgi:hypothetical protein